MVGLVDDLFELSRINAGALRLTLDSVPLAEVVSDAVASAAPVAAARGVRVVAAEDVWPTVRGSEPELSRIVANLLRNAIRHTPSDATVTVKAQVLVLPHGSVATHRTDVEPTSKNQPSAGVHSTGTLLPLSVAVTVSSTT